MTRHGCSSSVLLCVLLTISSTAGNGCMNLPGKESLATITPSGRRETGVAERLAKARSLENNEKWQEARELYQEMIVELPERHEPYHRLGVVADRQKRHREAEALYTQAIERKANDPDLFNDLGYCYYLQGKLTKAESAMLKAVSMAPSTARYRNNLGLVLGHQGRYDDALEAFRHAGSEADAQYNLAFIHASQDNMQGAKACFRRALVADPTFEPARQILDNFERIEADPSAEIANEPLVQNGVRWVPYVESGSSSTPVMQAGYETAANTSAKANAPASPANVRQAAGANGFSGTSHVEPARLSPAMTVAAPLR